MDRNISQYLPPTYLTQTTLIFNLCNIFSLLRLSTQQHSNNQVTLPHTKLQHSSAFPITGVPLLYINLLRFSLLLLISALINSISNQSTHLHSNMQFTFTPNSNYAPFHFHPHLHHSLTFFLMQVHPTKVVSFI